MLIAALYHPDKNPSQEAKDRLHVIYKAYEVLTDLGQDSEGKWKKKDRFDYYLKHPREYYKVSGYHSIRDIPKSDLGLVLFGVVIIASIVMHYAANARHSEVTQKLKNAIFNNLGVKNGGTRETLQYHREAMKIYEKVVAERRKNSTGKRKDIKMKDDPEFEKIVDDIVEVDIASFPPYPMLFCTMCSRLKLILQSSLVTIIKSQCLQKLKLENGMKKPEMGDLIVFKLLLLPYWLYQMVTAKKSSEENKID